MLMAYLLHRCITGQKAVPLEEKAVTINEFALVDSNDTVMYIWLNPRFVKHSLNQWILVANI